MPLHLPEWKSWRLQTRAGRTKTEARASRKGKRGRGVERIACLEN